MEAALLDRARDTRMSVAYQRLFVPSFGFGGTFQNEALTGAVHVPFASNRMYLEGSLAWFDNDPLEQVQPSLRTWWFSGTGGYRATRWLHVEVYVNRNAQDSQVPGGNIRRTDIGFRLVITKPMRIR